MEEKERYYYEKILRDCVIPEGLFEIKDREGNFYLIIENKKDVDTITNLLNQQDKRVKELEQELDDAKRGYIPKLEFGLQRANKMGRDTEKENQQLKQQLHDLPKKIVGEIRKQICEDCFWEECEEQHCEFYFIIEYLNAILKKYGGEDESK